MPGTDWSPVSTTRPPIATLSSSSPMRQRVWASLSSCAGQTMRVLWADERAVECNQGASGLPGVPSPDPGGSGASSTRRGRRFGRGSMWPGT